MERWRAGSGRQGDRGMDGRRIKVGQTEIKSGGLKEEGEKERRRRSKDKRMR